MVLDEDHTEPVVQPIVIVFDALLGRGRGRGEDGDESSEGNQTGHGKTSECVEMVSFTLPELQGCVNHPHG
jgi:hypothetical protein